MAVKSPPLLAAGRLVGAAVSGALVYLAYAPLDWWFAGLAGIALFWLCVQPGPQGPVSLRFGALLGFVHALASYLLLLPWVGYFVGTMPYVALSFFLALYALVLGVAAAALARTRLGWIGFAFAYLVVEVSRSTFPFGGFGWVRLAWSMVDSPLAGLAPLGGPALVTLCAVLLSTALAQLMRIKARTKDWGVAAAVLVGVVALSLAVPYGLGQQGIGKPAGQVGEAQVAAIQGNVPRLGLDFNAQRRAVLTNHVNVTQEAAAAEPDVDFYVWPENSSDVNPLADAEAKALVRAAVHAAHAPILVGTLTTDEVGDRNTMLVFDENAQPQEFHHKKYLQPFGETMPMRDFFAKLSDWVEYAGDFKPGTGNGLVHIAGVPLGVATCYEVSFDAAFRSAVLAGAQILTTPTNNATFGYTDMTYQQLAMSRFRAIETDRAVIVPATSGVSALVAPDGEVLAQSEIFEPKFLVDTLPLRDTVTPAVKYGSVLQMLGVAIGIIWTVAAIFAAQRARRRDSSSAAAAASTTSTTDN